MFIDAATVRALMGKLIEAAKTLVEEMAANNYHWTSERATWKRTSGKYAIDAVDLLTSKVGPLCNGLSLNFFLNISNYPNCKLI